MTLMQFSGLLLVWLLSTLLSPPPRTLNFVACASTSTFFSLLFLLTFFFGFPLTSILVFRFDVAVAPPEILLQTLLVSVCFYAVYYATYKTRLRSATRGHSHRPLFTMNRVETHLTGAFYWGWRCSASASSLRTTDFCYSSSTPIARSSPAKFPAWR